MRSWFVSCFVLSTVVFLQACQARLRGPSGRIGLPGPKGAAPVKYCAISTKITTFLKRFRSVGLKGASGGGLRGRMVSYDVTCIVNLYILNKSGELVAMLIKTGLGNVLSPTLFILVNKIVLHNIIVAPL